MNIFRKVAQYVFRKELEEIRGVMQDMSADWQMVPYLAARQENAMAALSEFDPHLYDLIVRQVQDYQLVTQPGYSESYRLSMVRQSRAMYLTSPLISFAVELWTDYCFPDMPDVTAQDVNAQPVWTEFWSADRNAPVLGERELHRLSETVLTDGELFFVVFASKIDGQCTVRTIATDEIKEIIYDPDDKSVPLYYRRNMSAGTESVYYPDWHAAEDQLARAVLPAGAVLADTKNNETTVVVIHTAFRKINGRGWPLGSSGMDWESEYSQFIKSRAAVARAAASIVEKLKVKGGQRAIDALRARIGSSLTGSGEGPERNPPPAPGSMWLENDAVDRQWMQRPTGAGDAEKDGTAILTMAGLALKLYPHFLGHGEWYRLATSTSMEGPTLKSFNRYQAFWKSIWKDLFRVVVRFAEEYGAEQFSTHGADVSAGAILDTPPEQISAVVDAVSDFVDRQLIPIDTAQRSASALLRLALSDVGVQNVSEIFGETEGKGNAAAEEIRPFRVRGKNGAAVHGRRL